MPSILDSLVYQAVYRVTKRLITSGSSSLEGYRRNLNEGTALYRYVGYRGFRPQQEMAGRTIWTSPLNDNANRWTGVDWENKSGQQGLYLSSEEPRQMDTSFPELEHYQDSTLPPDQEISHFEYSSGDGELVWKRSKVSELRTMFLFTTNKELTGIDLNYENDSRGIIQDIYRDAKYEIPAAFLSGRTAEELYFDPEDASFNRAIGNAVLESMPVDFFITTSVRDRKSQNVIMRGEQGTAIECLKPQGRNTFYMNDTTKTTESVSTVADLIYNDTFDESSEGIFIPKELLEKTWGELAGLANEIEKDLNWEDGYRQIDEKISSEVSEKLKSTNDPFAQSLDKLEEQLLNDSFVESVKKTFHDFVIADSTLSKSFLSLYSMIGIADVTTVLQKVIVEPRFEKIANKDGSDAQSYIASTLLSELAGRKLHWLEQNAPLIQQRLVEASMTVTETSKELQTKQSSLSEINEALKQVPNDVQLQLTAHNLRNEIDQLTEKLKDAESRKEQADTDTVDNERERKEAYERKERMDEIRKEHRRERERV
ncbi:hypothetical protein NQ117_02145 [Paenibacillus sp. SC116]|uniref:hypothetical protein n=1 Tax=Paenibacillus sp. SC116 TaxID=2968986 RepID=UPI00215A15E8|nr:hypothetical protein [Paenibacillus sp. SC116]MCR8842473.1 hypothetical protein [Paenibacillus sp. SC116]